MRVPRGGTNASSESKVLILILLAAAVVVVLIGVIGAPLRALNYSSYYAYVAAVMLGILVAVSELVARYKDDPSSALLTLPAVIYVSVNAVASGGALFLTHVFAWDFGAADEKRIVLQVLVAGLGSAAVFRSSLFNVTIGDEVVGVGPSAVLNVILAAADRAVDRRRALIRATGAQESVSNMSFATAGDALVETCFALMQNVSQAERQIVYNAVSLLRDEQKSRGISDTLKLQLLGLKIMSVTGRRVLKRASDLVKAADLPTPLEVVDRIDRSLRGKVASALADGPISLTQLRQTAGISLEDLRTVLEMLVAGGVITITGDGGEESVRLRA